MDMAPSELARRLFSGYLLTIAFETPVLFFGLGKRYSSTQKLCAGALLTACSYPFVVLLFPQFWNPYTNYSNYLLVSEIFAPICECIVFVFAFQCKQKQSSKNRLLDYFCIVLANLTSFIAGEILKRGGLHFT